MYLRVLLITTMTYRISLNVLLKKIGSDRQFPVPILIQPIVPISLHLIYDIGQINRYRACCTCFSEPMRHTYI